MPEKTTEKKKDNETKSNGKSSEEKKSNGESSEDKKANGESLEYKIRDISQKIDLEEQKLNEKSKN